MTSARKTVFAPFFSEARHAATGEGWIVGVSYGPGNEVAHEHYAFATKDEAESCASKLMRGQQ